MPHKTPTLSNRAFDASLRRGIAVSFTESASRTEHGNQSVSPCSTTHVPTWSESDKDSYISTPLSMAADSLCVCFETNGFVPRFPADDGSLQENNTHRKAFEQSTPLDLADLNSLTVLLWAPNGPHIFLLTVDSGINNIEPSEPVPLHRTPRPIQVGHRCMPKRSQQTGNIDHYTTRSPGWKRTDRATFLYFVPNKT